jgi:hypothetical protein
MFLYGIIFISNNKYHWLWLDESGDILVQEFICSDKYFPLSNYNGIIKKFDWNVIK